MKACPHCRQAPHWHFARNVSRRENADHWMFTGCTHAERFKASVPAIPSVERAALAEKWDAHAEALFDAYTASFTEPERTRFRAVLWPTPPPVIPTELKLT